VDGLALARRLQALPGLSTVLLVAITGHAHREADAWEAGFDHLLLKPFDPDELRRLLAAGTPAAPFLLARRSGRGDNAAASGRPGPHAVAAPR
jgi:CheY-like chemotaxis protein